MMVLDCVLSYLQYTISKEEIYYFLVYVYREPISPREFRASRSIPQAIAPVPFIPFLQVVKRRPNLSLANKKNYLVLVSTKGGVESRILFVVL